MLDLYAGSGAVGLEAWSRGAARATLVESDPRTAALIAGNARSAGCRDAQVVTTPVATTSPGRSARVARSARRGPAYDVVFSDPPYALGEAARRRRPGTCCCVTAGCPRVPWSSWSAPRAAGSRGGPRASGVRRRGYGETALWYGHAPPTDDAHLGGHEPEEAPR